MVTNPTQFHVYLPWINACRGLLCDYEPVAPTPWLWIKPSDGPSFQALHHTAPSRQIGRVLAPCWHALSGVSTHSLIYRPKNYSKPLSASSQRSSLTGVRAVSYYSPIIDNGSALSRYLWRWFVTSMKLICEDY